MAERPDYVYVTYIESTPERVWNALTDADLTAEYWGHSNVSDWQPSSAWEHRRVGSASALNTTSSAGALNPASSSPTPTLCRYLPA